VEKPEDNTILRLPRYKWEDNIKKNFKRIGWNGLNYIHLAGNRDNKEAVMDKVIKKKKKKMCELLKKY
jgi:hypothetical protein